MHRLFVYGTLAPGRANHDVLKDIPGSWVPATLRGTLLEQGWGAAMGCPGIIPTADGEEVEGFVLSSTHLASHWPRLDAFEGEGYERVSVTVRVNGTHDVEAYVYALKYR
ncbi:MAG: gamma-glutamylcyclotransferase family protein [Arenicellales bacterium]|nr:gamma-glutamylcyclotransferase family protein [Arenicellales bacterium]